MRLEWPETANALTARMSRGFNGQDAAGLCLVIGMGGYFADPHEEQRWR